MGDVRNVRSETSPPFGQLRIGSSHLRLRSWGLLRDASVVSKQSFKKRNDPLPNSKCSQVLARVLALGGCTKRYGNMICFMLNQKKQNNHFANPQRKTGHLKFSPQTASLQITLGNIFALPRKAGSGSLPPGCHCWGPNLPLPPPQATVLVNPTRNVNLVVWLHWLLICRSIDDCQVYF